MPTREASLVLVLVLALAGCTGGGVAPQPSPHAASSAPSAATPTPGASAPSLAPSPPATRATPQRATEGPAPTTAPASPPTVLPKPTGVRFRESTACLLGEDPDEGGCRYPDEADDPDGTAPVIEVTRTVTWRAPRMEGVEVRVYGVVECISMPARPEPGTSGPCLVEHTRLADSALVLLATAPASAGKASWSWRGQEPGCDIWYPVGWTMEDFEQPYYAVVVAAYGPSGPLSIFAIATAAEWAWPSDDPGSMPC